MGEYLVNRILQAIPVLFLITLIVFIVVYLIPGDPAAVILGNSATEESLEAVQRDLGLDSSLPERYLIWLRHIAVGDLGSSILSRQPVVEMIWYALPVTVYLNVLSMLIALLIAVPSGTIAALRRNSWADLLFTSWAFFGVSVPSFWLGIVLIYVFAVRLRWAPLQGYVSPLDDFIGSVQAMMLPALTLGVFLSGPLMRYLRSSLLHVMAQEHVNVARAKGLSERRVVIGHMLRNSLIPFVTVLGIQLGYLLGGAVIIEEVFALPGIGRLAVSAIENRDFPVVQGIVLLVATGFVLINIVVDVLYAALDPRIRVGKGAV